MIKMAAHSKVILSLFIEHVETKYQFKLINRQQQYQQMQKLSYQKLQPFKSSQTKDKLTNEQRFWKKYQNKQLNTFPSTLAAISSNRNTQQLFIYAAARSLTIYDTSKSQIVKQISSFNNNITALCLRPDAAVMAIADETGIIEIMDTKEKFHLRTFKNHKKRVNTLEYLQNDLYSGGDDFILRHFDVAIGEVVHSYDNAHTDYIKSIKALEDNHILSASYDGYIKLFDFRVHQKAQMDFFHKQQLEAIDIFPSKLTFVACGGNKVSLWDVRTGKELFSACNNKKTVSGVHVVNQGSRFITTSYDQYMKVYKSDTFQLTYQDKLPASISCFDVSENNQHIFMGLEGGKLQTKSRNAKSQLETGDEEEQDVEDQLLNWMKKNEEKKFAYNDQYFYRGIYQKSQTFDIKFQQNQSKKVSQYDAFLKKFQYKQALITSLLKKNMMIFLSLVDELVQRGCLQRTVTSLADEQIVSILPILLPLIHNVKYSKTAIYLLQNITNSHLEPAIWKKQVREHIVKQLETIASLSKLDGMLELLQNNFQ